MASNGVNGVSSEEQGPLKVVIIGAGIGALSAAIGLRLEGHEVEVCRIC